MWLPIHLESVGTNKKQWKIKQGLQKHELISNIRRSCKSTEKSSWECWWSWLHPSFSQHSCCADTKAYTEWQGKARESMTSSLLPALESCGVNEHLHSSTAGLLQPLSGVAMQSTVTQHQFCTLMLSRRVNKVLSENYTKIRRDFHVLGRIKIMSDTVCFARTTQAGRTAGEIKEMGLRGYKSAKEISMCICFGKQDFTKSAIKLTQSKYLISDLAFADLLLLIPRNRVLLCSFRVFL